MLVRPSVTPQLAEMTENCSPNFYRLSVEKKRACIVGIMLEHMETHNIISFYSAPDPTRLCSRKASDVSNWKRDQYLV